MFSDEEHSCTGQGENLGTQQPEFTVADDGDSIRAADVYAFEHATRGCEWFGKHGMLVGDIVRNALEVDRRKF